VAAVALFNKNVRVLSALLRDGRAIDLRRFPPASPKPLVEGRG